jgi:hypothetical protein
VAGGGVDTPLQRYGFEAGDRPHLLRYNGISAIWLPLELCLDTTPCFCLTNRLHIFHCSFFTSNSKLIPLIFPRSTVLHCLYIPCFIHFLTRFDSPSYVVSSICFAAASRSLYRPQIDSFSVLASHHFASAYLLISFDFRVALSISNFVASCNSLLVLRHQNLMHTLLQLQLMWKNPSTS